MYRFLFMCAISFAGVAWAQSYPAKPLRFIVGFAPGGAPDTMTRLFADRLPATLGQPIVVENRPAAGGLVAADNVSKALPDGYTLLSTATASFIPALVKNVPYDPINDFAGIAPLANIHAAVVIGPSTNFNSLKEFIAFAKANPGKLTFGSSGIGTPVHMSSEQFRHAAGFEALHVPQKGAAQSIIEVVAGRLDFYNSPVVAALPMIKAGKLSALAVLSRSRVALLPNVPTMGEAGLPEGVFQSGVGMWAPIKTSQEIVQRLNGEITRVAQSAEVRDRLHSQGAEPWLSNPAQFDEFVRAYGARQAALIKALGIKPE
ncbi:MAG: Bug family tripartite tricarboxylate transporter substrate binding protein [Burkholderiales bacterium]